jgi:predicted secreted protein
MDLERGYPDMSEIIVRQPDMGRPVDASQGDVIILELEENLGTGYSWDLAGLPEFVTVAESSHEAARPPRLGASGVRRFRLVANGTGKGIIEGLLRRPWDAANVADRFSVQLSVR